MATEPRNPEREARDRVSLRQDRETKALTESQRAECERDGERQNRALENSLANQAKLEADKKIALAEHDKLWKQASDRLTPRPIPAPAFDMMGGPPARNLVQDHDEMRQRSTERRDQIVKDFDQRIASTQSSRAEMQQGFGRANEARDQAHSEARRDLAQRQQQSFEPLVKKELDRAAATATRAICEGTDVPIQPNPPRRACHPGRDYRAVFPGPRLGCQCAGLGSGQCAAGRLGPRSPGIACIALLLLYGLGGFVLLVGTGMAVYAAYFVLTRSLVAVRNWAMRISVATAQLLGALLCWAPQIVVELLCNQIQSGTAKLTAYRQERRQLRDIYRQDYAEDFPSYGAFLRHWRALQAAEQAKTDPLQQAIRLMGLTEPFTRDELKDRFHILIGGIHPDLVGPNELAAQLIAANTLICERKRWK